MASVMAYSPEDRSGFSYHFIVVLITALCWALITSATHAKINTITESEISGQLMLVASANVVSPFMAVFILSS